MSRRNYIYRLLRDTAMKWVHDEGFMISAALAYYFLFSIAPLLVIAVAIASVFFGGEAAQGEMEHQLTGYFGARGARAIQALLSAAQMGNQGGVVMIIIWSAVLLFGASSVFAQLKLALNRIWRVEAPRQLDVRTLLLNRLLALAMVAVVALLLLGSVLISAALGKLSAYATEVLPISPVVLQYADLAVTFLLLSILFAVIFRFLPDVRMGWNNVFLGAVFTSILFAIGKVLIGLYIAHGAVASGYGAVSSILVLMLWIYYSAIIFTFGAEFTYVYSRAYHLPAEPITDDPPPESVVP